MVSIEEFIEQVSNMRHLQKEYFRTRNSLVLSNAKKSEARVDESLNLLVKVSNPQQKLF